MPKPKRPREAPKDYKLEQYKDEGEHDHNNMSLVLKYEKGGVYAITINPHDKYQYEQKSDRMEKVRNVINALTKPLTEHGIEYIFNMEMSEPSTIQYNSVGARMHTHGIIIIKERRGVRYLLEQWLTSAGKIGITYIPRINDEENAQNWLKYMKKQQDYILVEPLCNRHITEEVEKLIMDTLSATLKDGAEPKARSP